MSLFVDLIELSENQTDEVLGYAYKALHGHDDDDAIWDEHPSPMVRRLVELFSSRGLTRLDNVRRELIEWLEGERHEPTLPPERPTGAAQRWSLAEMDLATRYLEALPPDQWTMDDHMMMVDLVCQRHLPADALRDEAAWLATRSSLMGRLQAAVGELQAGQAEAVAQRLPEAPVGATTRWAAAVQEVAATRAAEHVTSVADDTRHRMRSLVARRVERTMLGEAGGPDLRTELRDAFAPLNRDWRRIAITEATEALGQGFIAAQQPGARVKRVEQYRNACTWCRKIDGLVLRVVDPDTPEKDGETEVWVGKSNVGRSSAPRKRVGNVLVEREPAEMWWPSAGAQHPHCRGRWLPVVGDPENSVDPEFTRWAMALLQKKE